MKEKNKTNKIMENYMNMLFLNIPEKDYIILYQKYEKLINDAVLNLKGSYAKGKEYLFGINASDITEVYMNSGYGKGSITSFIETWVDSYIKINECLKKAYSEEGLYNKVSSPIRAENLVKMYMNNNYRYISAVDYTETWINSLIEIENKMKESNSENTKTR